MIENLENICKIIVLILLMLMSIILIVIILETAINNIIQRRKIKKQVGEINKSIDEIAAKLVAELEKEREEQANKPKKRKRGRPKKDSK